MEYFAYEGEDPVTYHFTLTVPDSSAEGLAGICVNGEILDTLGQVQRDILLTGPVLLSDTIYQWNITVAATQNNSDITIECFAFGYGIGQATSNTVTFKVQGKLIVLNSMKWLNKVLIIYKYGKQTTHF